MKIQSCTLRIGCIDRIRQMNTADEVPNGNAREMRALSSEIKSIGMLKKLSAEGEKSTGYRVDSAKSFYFFG